jgi:putative glutamine amidotransferase
MVNELRSARLPRSPRARARGGQECPLIGVTTSEVRTAEDVRPVAEGEPPRREMALGLTYLQAIERAGGAPVVLPPLGPGAVGPWLDRLEGLCLSGGPDLDPATYGQRAGEHLGPTWADLDFFELAVARGADSRGLPILAICRGMQTLNVARGGTLHQHLGDSNEIAHRQRAAAEEPTHTVRIDGSSRLAEVMGSDSAEVNSFHHQAVDWLGSGIRPVAWAPDGVVEGFQAEDREFVLGVQWHAECLTDRPEELALFDAFVETAATRAPARQAT